MIYLVRIHAAKISGWAKRPKCARGKDPDSTVEVSVEFCEEGSEGARIFHSKSCACQCVEAAVAAGAVDKRREVVRYRLGEMRGLGDRKHRGDQM
jgi:hypothetical protein